MPTLTKTRKKKAEVPKRGSGKKAKATVEVKKPKRTKQAEPKKASVKKIAHLDPDRARDLAISQMRVELPELGLAHDTSSKGLSTYRNDSGVRVSLRGHHVDGTVNSPVHSYYLAVMGTGTKIKKYPQLRSGKFSWDDIKTKIKELVKMSNKTKWVEIAGRLDAKLPKHVPVKLLPAASDKEIRVRFQFDKDLDENTAADLFKTIESYAIA